MHTLITNLLIPAAILPAVLFPGRQPTPVAPVSSRTLSIEKNDSVFSDTACAQKFFDCIYQKYPGTYFPLGSKILFLESYNTETKKLVWQFSFFVMDSTKKGAGKYLHEINDPSIAQYLPGIHFYSGIHSHHYEIGGSAHFLGYIYKNQGDFALERMSSNLNPDLVALIKKASIPGTTEKEKFCSALLQTFLPTMIYYYSPEGTISTKFTWSGNALTVTKTYLNNAFLGGPQEYSLSLLMVFNGDQVSTVLLQS